MKKVLLFILFAGFIYGQAGNQSPDTWTQAAISDSLDRLDDSLAIHLDTLQALRVDININVDSLTAIRTDVNTNVDSLEAIRTDVDTNIDSLTAIRTDVNAITTSGSYLLLTGDNTVSGDNDYTGTNDFTTGKVLIGEKPVTPIANQLTMDITAGSSGLYWENTRIPDVDGVEGLIDNNYSYNAPEIVTAAIDTIDFTNDRNFIKAIYDVPQDGVNIKVNNSGVGAVTIVVNSTQEAVTITSLGTDPIYFMGDIEPDYSYSGLAVDTKYKLTISRYYNVTRYEVDVEWTYLVKQ